MKIIIFEKDIIVKVCVANRPDKVKLKKGQKKIEVPEWFSGLPGNNLKEFDSEWNFLPLSDRIAKGYVKVPKHMKFNGGQLEPLSPVEKLLNSPDGKLILSELKSMVDKKLRSKK
jgi:hypothetical protein